MIKKHDDFEDSDDSGSGGKSGQVEFRAFVSMGGETRDDLLSYDKKRSLLSQHQDLSEASIKKQSEILKKYKDLKDKKIPLNAVRAEKTGRGLFESFPELTDKPQFHGSNDNKVNSVPNEFDAETNQEKQQELRYQAALRAQPELRYAAQPKFNPKPRGPGF